MKLSERGGDAATHLDDELPVAQHYGAGVAVTGNDGHLAAMLLPLPAAEERLPALRRRAGRTAEPR